MTVSLGHSGSPKIKLQRNCGRWLYQTNHNCIFVPANAAFFERSVPCVYSLYIVHTSWQSNVCTCYAILNSWFCNWTISCHQKRAVKYSEKLKITRLEARYCRPDDGPLWRYIWMQAKIKDSALRSRSRDSRMQILVLDIINVWVAFGRECVHENSKEDLVVVEGPAGIVWARNNYFTWQHVGKFRV